MSDCEISKDKTWVGQYHCNTHDVWFRNDGDSVESCPAGEIEDEHEAALETAHADGANALISSFKNVDPRARICELEAEVERLKVELERQRILHNECAQCGAALHDCTEPPHCDGCVVDEDKFAEWEVATATSPERLKAHTWQQERAAIVKWFDERFNNKGFDGVTVLQTISSIAKSIKVGEHWPEGGEG